MKLYRRVASAALVVIAVATSACTESSTAVSTTAPESISKCQVSLTAPSMVEAAGGTASVAVTTQPECTWNASTPANWISGLSPASGQGTGSVSFRVAANDGSSVREADFHVNEGVVRVTQRAPCRYEIKPATVSVDAGSGGGTVTIATSSDCSWSASSDANWITLPGPNSGSGNGTVTFTVAANTGAQRTGNISVGGQRIAITQAAIGPVPPPPSPSPTCNFSISPNSQNMSALGGTGAVNVSTAAGCQWTASSNASWISVVTGAGGSGNGTVTYLVIPNLSGARSGTLTVAGRPFTVNQAAAAPCAYSISPSTQKVLDPGGTVTVAVSTDSGCAWTAVSNDSWITITAGASGTGNGTVVIAVAKNDGKDRKGTLTIAGKIATIEQKEK